MTRHRAPPRVDNQSAATATRRVPRARRRRDAMRNPPARAASEGISVAVVRDDGGDDRAKAEPRAATGLVRDEAMRRKVAMTREVATTREAATSYASDDGAKWCERK